MHELVRQALGAVEAGEHESSEDFLDDRGLERHDRMILAVLAEASGGKHGMDVRVRIREGPEGLDREHDGRTEIVPFEGGLAVATLAALLVLSAAVARSGAG